MGEYIRNHIATSAYLGTWADATGCLSVIRVHANDDHARLARPDSVAFRKYFWGWSPSLRREMEQLLSDLEGEVAPGLVDLASRWPLAQDRDERINLALFLAVHLFRTPGWQRLVPILAERTIREEQQHLRRFRLSHAQISAVARDDAWRAMTFSSQVPLLGRMLAAMNWSLVSFDAPVLITGDQPVVAVPCDPGGAEETVAPLPAAGLLHTLEFRFAIDPSHLLLLTWIDSREDGSTLAGTPWVAATANRAVRAQADTEWFHCPGTNPLFVAPPFLQARTPHEPISPSLLPLYSAQRAAIHDYGERSSDGSTKRSTRTFPRIYAESSGTVRHSRTPLWSQSRCVEGPPMIGQASKPDVT